MDPVRLDLWLWAARFYKTRALAARAIDGGKIELNGDRPKRAKTVRMGDLLRIRSGPEEYRVTVTALAGRRGGATEAAALYREDPESAAARERAKEQRRLARAASPDFPGRPTKKQRRDLDRWRGQG